MELLAAFSGMYIATDVLSGTGVMVMGDTRQCITDMRSEGGGINGRLLNLAVGRSLSTTAAGVRKT